MSPRILSARLRSARILPGTLVALVLLVPSLPALAYSIRMETDYAGDPLQVGDTFSVDVRLDTEGESAIAILSVGVLWDPTVVALRTDLSNIELQALYDPGAGPSSETYLENLRTDPYTLWPAPPAGLEQLNLDYLSNQLLTSGAGTVATSSDALLATLVFEATGVGSTELAAAIAGGNVFSVYRDGSYLDVTGELGLPAPLLVDVGETPLPDDVRTNSAIPEPSGALLFAAGWGVLAGRRRRALARGAGHTGPPAQPARSQSPQGMV